ncbi:MULTISPECIES: ribonuclease P protein component [unclassified Mycolicibacterium]|uniref:ribonuclease P protein component n=1 Tax=unclassified Mycolicibacterium TaxID=2636767 RepID=UPI001305DE1B|nr:MULTISPECIES: ribonuclease P protein component [unclassified Mycolicibacterium]MUL82917.1 ribonuclease P protein component [Mycolicibacterium sp. CBMA 329]MUL89252.1 ribonuclease P protein component [Mycolicibacterium sp. CBMA 331]MUL97819.1 ribonuclease P protein component [Mycolicibacterium sp. CBMA 334]MUM30108.1 ribonuclease P protein component [Mycolicibacterium sp. CBMA 295]MUM38768.1 ribonuclease P protein component [Mycolicibacterium sp. CBMA 247]
MLPARYRMRRSAEFSATVSRGARAVQPDVVVHALHDGTDATGPRVGLIVSKAVGNAVQRHRVSRRLRHAARTVIPHLNATDLVVIRARPGSSEAPSLRLEQQLHRALERLDARRGTSP